MADDKKKMWGGRFAQGTDASVEAFTASIDFDKALYLEDIAGSMAHAAMLARQGVITADEAEAIRGGLEKVRAEIEAGEMVWHAGLEDVHMHVERRLTELIGSPGGKLHTGRSRNDQVALDFRLHVTRRLGEWAELLAGLAGTLTARAEGHQDVLLPGHTHLQPAQPVSLAHHLLAYAWMFRRDHERVGDCLRRVMVSPLGAAALAGTTHDLDPASVAGDLGLSGVFANSMDAVSDRDFAIEALSCAAMIMMHLSRLCEELIIWANPRFGWVRLPDAYATGSSIMPQKKNPDVAELVRGKTGRVYGDLTALLTLMKGLPLAYNRDMQEDKEPFFDADATVRSCLALTRDMMAAMGFDASAMCAALQQGFLNATELADYLAAKGLPFREAHHAAGSAVALAEEKGCGLEDLSLGELKSFSELVEDDVFQALTPEAAVARRRTSGGTGPQSVSEQIRSMRQWLEQMGGE